MKQNCNVPAFLSKLWTLVEDHSTNDLICWSQNGCSFLVCDEQRFSKEILPLYFKHSNMTSFVRQLNMYGFRKVVQVEAGLPRGDARGDCVEFQHLHFRQTQPHLLELIRRKVSLSRNGDEGVPPQMSQVLLELGQVRGWQDKSDSKLMALRRENESLWREVDCLRQRYQQHHKIIRKIIHFIASTVQSNGITGLKRKLPLMIDGSGLSHSPPKYSRTISLDGSQSAAALHGVPHGDPWVRTLDPFEELGFSSGSVYTNGMIISDVTDLLDLQTEELDCSRTKADDLSEASPESRLSSSAAPTVELDLSLLEDPEPAEPGENALDRNDASDPMALIDSSLAAMRSGLPLSPGPGLDLLSELFNPVLGSQSEDAKPEVLKARPGPDAWAEKQPDTQTVAALDWVTSCREEEEEEEVEEGSDILPSLLQLAEEASEFAYCPTALPADPLPLV
ncbi:heat shock factor protein 1 [Scleropages formosus]|uniref:heat shock factor protein 1 n=1 Tax=Scleropages formosus TaxID=113540 RepID=UPI000878774A|nr:heat shock factor protein 1-like [Scleropages formosus]